MKFAVETWAPEYGIGFLRTLAGSTDAYQMADALEQLGQGLYFPPSVKGWDGGRTWVNSSTLLGRANLIRRLVDGGKTRFDKKPLGEYLRSQNIESVGDLIDWFEAGLFAVPIPADTKQRLAQLSESSKSDFADLSGDAVHILCTLPEFQLA